MVKSIHFLLFIIINSTSNNLVNCQELFKLGNSCSYSKNVSNTTVNLYYPSIEAEHIIDKIMKMVSLPSNFIIKASNVDNAVATLIQTESDKTERFILYNPDFIESVKSITGNDYSAWSILAHEIGHHLSGHTLGGNEDSHLQELEADEFSGYVMYKMGASLTQSQSAINKFCSEVGSLSHPPKSKRLLAISRGWYNAKNNSPNPVKVSGGEIDNTLTYQGTIVVMIIQSAKTGESINEKVIGTKPILKYIPVTKKWQISYTDENGNFSVIELSYLKDTEDGSIMIDTYGAKYDVTNGVNSNGMLFCQLLDFKGEAFAYISFEGLIRK